MLKKHLICYNIFNNSYTLLFLQEREVGTETKLLYFSWLGKKEKIIRMRLNIFQDALKEFGISHASIILLEISIYQKLEDPDFWIWGSCFLKGVIAYFLDITQVKLNSFTLEILFQLHCLRFIAFSFMRWTGDQVTLQCFNI